MNKIFGIKIEKYRTFINFLGLRIKLKNKVSKKYFVLEEYLKLYADKSIDKKILDREINSFEKYGLYVGQRREEKIVVSLTSFPDRIKELKYSLYSLLNQTLKPDKVILYLAKSQFKNGEKDLDESIVKLKGNGLEIKFCEKDLKSYKKLYYVVDDFPESIIVTADDDIFYPSNWLKDLYESHLKNRDVICANHVKKVLSIFKNFLLPYKYWPKQKDASSISFSNFFVGFAGVLYPVNSLNYKLLKNYNLFEQICPFGDDIWFWACALKNGTKIKVNEKICKTLYVNIARELGLTDEFSLFRDKNKKFGNDDQLRKVIAKLDLKKML